MGLGICYLGSTLANCEKIAEVLQLPHQVVPVVGMVVGYPDENETRKDRLPVSGLVHHDTYRQYTDEEILDIYREREIYGWQRYLSNP